MPQITKLTNIPLSRLLEIKANHYRSKDAKRDYCQVSVDDRINELNDKHNAELLQRAADHEALMQVPILPPRYVELKSNSVIVKPSVKSSVSPYDMFKVILDLSSEHSALLFKQNKLKEIGW